MAVTHRARRVLKTAVFAVGKRVPALIRVARSARTRAEARRYQRETVGIALEPKAAVFEAYLGRSYACSPRAIFERMLADGTYGEWRLTWAFQADLALALAESGLEVRGLDSSSSASGEARDLERSLAPRALEALKRAEIVAYGSRAYHEAYARSAYWVTNSMLAQHLVPGPGQSYVQTWHGTPLKRLGCDVAQTGYALIPLEELHRRYRTEGERLTTLVTPSRFTSEKLASAFALGEAKADRAIVEVGYPRNDFLLTHKPEDAESARGRLGVPAGKRAILYAPTWRDDQHDSRSGYTYRTEVDFARLKQLLGDEYVILFRAHYFVTNSFDFAAYDGFVLDASGVDDVNEVCIASDVLVTDYSSLFFDYANLGRPIIFYMYDQERYESEQRGFYLDLLELPGPVARNEEELAAALRAAAAGGGVSGEAYARFRGRFTYLDDGCASERVLQRVIPSAKAGAAD